MSVDPSIYGFISQPFRYAKASDPLVKLNYEQARIVEVPGVFTNLVDAETVNDDLFSLIKIARRRFSVLIQEVNFFDVDEFDGTCPTCTLRSDSYGLEQGLLTLVIGSEVNVTKGTTLLDCWG